MNFYKFNRIVFFFSVTVCLEMTKAGCDSSGDEVLRRVCWADLLAGACSPSSWVWCGASCAWRRSPAPLVTWKGGWSGKGGHHLRLLPFGSQSSVDSPRPPLTSSAPTCSVLLLEVGAGRWMVVKEAQSGLWRSLLGSWSISRMIMIYGFPLYQTDLLC